LVIGKFCVSPQYADTQELPIISLVMRTVSEIAELLVICIHLHLMQSLCVHGGASISDQHNTASSSCPLRALAEQMTTDQ